MKPKAPKAKKAKPQDFQDRLRNFHKTIVKAQSDYDARNLMRARRIQAEKDQQEKIMSEIIAGARVQARRVPPVSAPRVDASQTMAQAKATLMGESHPPSVTFRHVAQSPAPGSPSGQPDPTRGRSKERKK